MSRSLKILVTVLLFGFASAQVPNPRRVTDDSVALGQKIPNIKYPLIPSSLIPSGFKSTWVSLPLATFEEAPRDLSEMPRVKANPAYPQTKSGDELYDVSTWFQKGMTSNPDRKQWVYYNNTSKHLIACADIFLRTYLHNYVVAQVYGYPKQLKIQMEYIEVNENVLLDIDSIQKSTYKRLYKASWSQSMQGYSPSYYDGEINLTIEGRFSYPGKKRYGELAIDFSLLSKSFGDLKFSTVILSGKTMIKELGISPFGMRRVLVLKVECLNADQVAIMPPPSQSKFERMFSSQNSGDPFEPILYSKAYTVPPDLIDLVLEEGVKKETYLLKQEHPFFNKLGLVYDVTPIIKTLGVPINGEEECAYFSKNSELLLTNLSVENHDLVGNLLAGLEPDIPTNYQVYGQIYEVGLGKKPQRSVLDILRVRPRPVVNLSALAVYGGIGGFHNTMIKNNAGTFTMESQDGADFLLKINTSNNGSQLKGEYLLKLDAKSPQVFEMGRSKNPGKAYVLVVELKSF